MKRLLLAAAVLALLVVFISPAGAQAPEPPVWVRQLLGNMTPEERVGQLFLVTFRGAEVNEDSEIRDLLLNYHVGGVVLDAANDNFTAAPNTVTDTYRLIATLQNTERQAAKVQELNTETGRLISPAYVPLWVGIAQDGGSASTGQILNGLTPLPSEMALGATWQPDLAGQVGEVAGRELSALGFNLYFGPSLDVLDQPSASTGGDLGTRVFGGDPFWVGEMGRAFISGLHKGSGNRMLVIGKHFPGLGSSDRPPDQEVATVRKSLEQLKQIELAPFFAVTGNAPDTASTADGLLVSHIRYQGFQGNIRATTRPVSFDAQALGEILKLEQFSTWRQKGGLIVSDDLGSRAVRDFYAPGNSAFNARLIVRDAFLSGTDLLYLGNIYTESPADHNATVKQILTYFTQRYTDDAAFAQRVDEAVTRILIRKYALYGTFPEAGVTPDVSQLAVVGNSSHISFRVAGQAASLISPDPQDMNIVLPEPPLANDYLVFLTDVSTTRQCTACPEEPQLAVNAFEQSVLRLYGTAIGGPALPNRLRSYAFTDLSKLLDGTSVDNLEADLRRATWVIISITDASQSQAALVHQLLANRQDILRSKKIILFAFGAPYYFDSTDIAKLSAYYALYSKSPSFIDVAARILYQELMPAGHSPVSVPGTGYDLIQVTAPDPGQIITLFLDLPAASVSTAGSQPSATPEPTLVPLFEMGDSVTVRTGVIRDHNGNPVPDGTVVRFIFSLGGEGGGVFQQTDANTLGGAASISFRIDKPGLLEVRATSEPAAISEVLQLNVTEGAAAAVTVIVPVVSQTVETPLPTPSPMPQNDFVTPEGAPRFGGWMLSLMVVGGGALLAYWVGGSWGRPRWSARWALCSLLGGLTAYNYLALGFPGAANILMAGGGGALVGFTVLGELAGAFCAWLWMNQRTK